MSHINNGSRFIHQRGTAVITLSHSVLLDFGGVAEPVWVQRYRLCNAGGYALKRIPAGYPRMWHIKRNVPR